MPPRPRPARPTPPELSAQALARAVRHGEALALGEGDVKRTAVAIRATDGVTLAGSFYAPALADGLAAGTVVINSATGVKRGYYDGFARFLAREGFRVLTYDYRGVGGSRPESLRGYEATARQWGERDVEGVLAWARARFPGDRRLVIGHSIGGQLLGLAPSSGTLDAVLLVGAQVGYWGLYGAPWRWLFAGIMYGAIPFATRFAGYFPARRLGLGEDLPAGVALEWAAWCREPRYFFAPSRGVPTDAFGTVHAPVRAVTVSDDPLAPPRATAALAAAFTGARVEHRLVRPADAGVAKLGHFGYFRPAIGMRLWPADVAWLRGAVAE